MKSILTMAWTAEDPAAFELAARLAKGFGARLVGLEPPSYGVMSMAWADAGMGAPIGGGLAEDAEERQRVAAVRQAFDARALGLTSEWRAADDSGPTAIGIIGRAYDLIVMPQPGALPIVINGQVIGARGVSSGDGEKCAQSAIDSVFKGQAKSSTQ